MNTNLISVVDVVQFAAENVDVPFFTLAQSRPFKIGPSRTGIRFDLPSKSYFQINREVIAKYLSIYYAALPEQREKTTIWPSKMRERSYVARTLFEIRNSRALGVIKQDEKEIENAPETIREALTLARIGQGQFRDNLLAEQKCCYVTGISDPRLLRAAHIQPWSISTNEERLDKDNGFLLSPVYDHLFDRYLISFRDDGRMMVSQSISPAALKALRIEQIARGSPLGKRTKQYLAFHRAEFQRQEKIWRERQASVPSA